MATVSTLPNEVTGDAALGELWQEHGGVLRRFALRLTLGDYQHADEVVQETMLRAWKHPEAVGPGGKAARAWLFTVSRRAAIDLWRSRRRAEAFEEVMDDRHAQLPDPAEPIERAVEAMDVRAALARLNTDQRAVITVMYLHGHTATETAAILGIPVGTVKSRGYHALRTLRETIPAARVSA